MGPLSRFLNDVARALEPSGQTGVSRQVHYQRNENQSARKYYFAVIPAKSGTDFKYKILPD